MITRFFLLFLVSTLSVAGETSTIRLHHMHAQSSDYASLQRGARLYVNYCLGCHSLQYMRYSRLAQDIGIVDKSNAIDESRVKNNLVFTDDKIFDTMRTAMDPKQAAKWFGVAPPDLSVISRVRGVDWLYTYLLSFYRDPKRPFGVNNALFPDVAMPNVLAPLQGEQVPYYVTESTNVADNADNTEQIKRLDHLTLRTLGQMDAADFDSAVMDLVNFLAYVGEPAQIERKHLGPWVLLFLALFTGLAYCLKRAYWKEIK